MVLTLFRVLFSLRLPSYPTTSLISLLTLTVSDVSTDLSASATLTEFTLLAPTCKNLFNLWLFNYALRILWFIVGSRRPLGFTWPSFGAKIVGRCTFESKTSGVGCTVWKPCMIDYTLDLACIVGNFIFRFYCFSSLTSRKDLVISCIKDMVLSCSSFLTSGSSWTICPHLVMLNLLSAPCWPFNA